MKRIRIGIFGTGRGEDIAENIMLAGGEVVALCDFHEGRLNAMAKKMGASVAVYQDFDEFIKHPMDGVILSNFFHQHAPYAVKCLEKGIHVLSECISNGTMAEGVALARAARNSKAVYMMAENYPYMIFNREIKKICDGGTLGKIVYAEGEYNHPVDPNDLYFLKRYKYFPKHWRNYLPGTYYITHSLGPIMHATGATPKRVTAFAAFAPVEGDVPTASYVGDRAAIIMTQNDDDSVFKITGCAAFGAHENSYRVCGVNGQVENLRGMQNQVMLRYNSWSVPEGGKEESLYTPDWNDADEELIKKAGHDGADFLTVRMFMDCIREGKQPEHPFNLQSALAMSSVAILGHRSVLEGGKPFDIPDFTKEEDCALYENDYLTPFPGMNGEEPTIPCCSKTDFVPTQEQLKLYRELVMEEK